MCLWRDRRLASRDTVAVALVLIDNFVVYALLRAFSLWSQDKGLSKFRHIVRMDLGFRGKGDEERSVGKQRAKS